MRPKLYWGVHEADIGNHETDVIDQALGMKNICWHWEINGISLILQGQTLAADTVIFGSKIPYKYIKTQNLWVYFHKYRGIYHTRN